MTEPRQHIRDAFDARPFGQKRARDHDDGKFELARGIDFGPGAVAAGIARDDTFDAARAHEVAIAVQREGAAGNDDLGVGQRQSRVGCIDKAQEIRVLRFCGEGRQMLPADGEEHPRRRVGQRGCGSVEIGDFAPPVTVRSRPRRALQRDQRGLRHSTGFDRMAADLGRERMGRIDNVRDPLLPEECGETFDAAKAADPRWQCVRQRNPGAAGIGVDCIDVRARNSFREPIGIACSAQYERARHE